MEKKLEVRFQISKFQLSTFSFLPSQTASAHSPKKHASKIVTPVESCHVAIAATPLRAATQTRMDIRARLNTNDIANPPKTRPNRRATFSRYNSPRNNEIISV